MNQEKIGKFIAKLRKEKNMTQLQLSLKLGVTDRAISKWENGRGMPDLSLMKPLCNELGITINDLLSGEVIDKNNYQEKLEENILNTIDYTDEKIRKNKKTFKTIIICLCLGLLLLILMFFIDVKRMNDGKNVIFSRWGFDYYPLVDLHEDYIYYAIKDYVIENGDNEEMHYDFEKTFASLKIYKILENEKSNSYFVYTIVKRSKYYMDNDTLLKDSDSLIPYKFIIKYDDNKYKVTDFIALRDGEDTYYKDLKSIFPKSVLKNINNIYSDGTSDKLEMEIMEDVKLYFHK